MYNSFVFNSTTPAFVVTIWGVKFFLRPDCNKEMKYEVKMVTAQNIATSLFMGLGRKL